jgi:hypothetical protein
MMAGLAQGATIRYQGSGDYNDVVAVTGANGWQSGGGGPGGLPGAADTIRFNWGNNIVTLTNVAPTVTRFQMGVDESGQLVVDTGGQLTATGTGDNMVGNNGGVGVIGRLTVNTNGVVNSVTPLEVGANATGFLTIDGGTVNLTSHLWVGSAAAGVAGTINLTNGGTLNVGGMLGLGTINAVSPSGGTGLLHVNGGGVLHLSDIAGSGLGSIQPGSVLDISGSGEVTIPGDRVATMTAYVSAGRITAYGGTGTVAIDYNITHEGKTTLKAVGGYVPPTDVVWNPAANPSGHGLWNESANWTGGLLPASVTKVTFNVVGAIPCTVTNSAVASYVVMGDNGPGGTLSVTNGGILTCGPDNATIIGNNSNALMVVENGGSVSLGFQLWIGFDPGADGTLVMNGGTVSVANMFGLGWQGGKGTAQVKGGTLNLSQWDDSFSIQGQSVLDVSGTGKVVMNGDHQASVNAYIASGNITADGGVGTVVVDYNIINVGKTTVYPLGLYLPPAQDVWNPAANPATTGLWSESANWTSALVPGDVTFVTFNVPDAIPCTVTNAAVASVVRIGSGGPGGTLIITNGASLTALNGGEWNSIGMSSNGLMVVENGASVSFANHLWVGFDPTAEGTLIMNGGTVSVGQMFGLGWNGGTGTAQINGGTLNLAQLSPTDSIKGASVLNLTGLGTVVITGNQLAPVGNYISAGKITANGGPNVAYSYDSGANKTTLQVAPPQQSITIVTASGGNMTITYQTTPGHIYHIESTASLSPASWARVAGSTTTATGGSASFTFPVTGAQTFYRTVSP